MQNMVKELQLLVPFKNTTDVGDIILIVAKEPHILQYAVVTNITRDESRKDEWWHVDFSFLSIPIQEATWTLRSPQMTGAEIFTMGGEERFVAAVDFKKGKEISPEVLEEALATQPEKAPAKNKNIGGLRRVK